MKAHLDERRRKHDAAEATARLQEMIQKAGIGGG